MTRLHRFTCTLDYCQCRCHELCGPHEWSSVVNSFGDLLLGSCRCDRGGGQSSTVLARLINRELSSAVMTALACSTGRNQLALGLVEADQLNAVGGTVLSPEGRAVEADTGLYAD